MSSRDELQGGWVEPVVRQEQSEDHEAVREVHTQAFGDGERVPALVDALRAAQAPLAPLSLVATVGERVVGHVMLSACRLDALPRLVTGAFQVAKLSSYEEWMTGTFVYSDVFWALDFVGPSRP